jgi:hypothetical protein
MNPTITYAPSAVRSAATGIPAGSIKSTMSYVVTSWPPRPSHPARGRASTPHMLVAPNAHPHEPPARHGHAVHDPVRDTAIAIRRTAPRQHDEPAGDQHVFPGYTGDDLYFTRRREEFAPAEQHRGTPAGCVSISGQLNNSGLPCVAGRSPPGGS